MLRTLFLFVVLGLLVLTGPAHAREPAAASASPVAPTLRPLAEVALYPLREAAAEVVALNESRIATEIAGRIEALAVEPGQTIARGALIARIDCRDHELARDRARAALEAAQARAALAQAQLARARTLREQGFFSPEALAARETETRVLDADAGAARTQLELAARTIGKCEVRAPFAAIVRQRLGQLGELAAPGTPLASLIDLERIEVSAHVQAQDGASLRAAKAVRFEGEAAAIPVSLIRLSPAIDRVARTVEARLRFGEVSAAPGAQGRIVWRDVQAHLPPALVLRRGGRLGVFVEREGKARFHRLPQAQEGRPAATDLPADARIVVLGHLALEDGAPLAPGNGAR